jgi:hypothetical protein
MPMKRIAAVLLTSGFMSLGHAQSAALEHSTPSPQEMVVLDFNGGSNRYDDAVDVSMAGNRITVVYKLPGADFPEPPPPPPGGYQYQAQLGKFPAGDYEVAVMSGSAVVATIPFHVVASSTSVQPIEDHTDLWWNPQESGWGLNLVQHGSGPIFATWFVYGADGSPQWYVIPGGQWTSPIQFSGSIYRTAGPDIAGTFDPSKVTQTLVGSATLHFTGGKLQVALTADGQTTSKVLQRQSF